MKTVSIVVVPEYQFGIERHFTRIPLESMMVGMPVIISADVSNKEVYKKMGDREHYIAVDPTNQTGFTRKLELLLESNDLRMKLSKNTKNFICSLNNFDTSISTIENYFKVLIENLKH